MKPNLFITLLMSLAATQTQAEGMAVTDRCRAFEIEAAPLSGDILESDVWDFSQQWKSSGRAATEVKIYGDTLMAETVNGRRLWYAVVSDSVFYTGEEDRLTNVSLDSMAMVFSIPLRHGFSSTSPFTASGTGAGRRFDVREEGMIDFRVSDRRGILILAPGDTVRAVMASCERRNATCSFPTDSGRTTAMVVENFRWYDAEGMRSLLPLAVQRTIYFPNGQSGTDATAYSAAFLQNREEMQGHKTGNDDSVDGDTELLEEILRNAVVAVDGGTVTISVAMPGNGFILTVDVMDVGGRLYLHQRSQTSSMTIDCSALRGGEYIVALSFENTSCLPEKRYIQIR